MQSRDAFIYSTSIHWALPSQFWALCWAPGIGRDRKRPNPAREIYHLRKQEILKVPTDPRPGLPSPVDVSEARGKAPLWHEGGLGTTWGGSVNVLWPCRRKAKPHLL